MPTNPYAPPVARVADSQGLENAPALWNPNAAANWSLLFSPAFGAFLHMLNWQALGDAQKAASARHWLIASLVVLAVYLVLSLALADSKAPDAAGLAYLFVWYFSVARGQVRYVKDKFGKTYPRRGWAKPLLIGVLAMIGYMVLAVIVRFLFSVAAQA